MVKNMDASVARQVWSYDPFTGLLRWAIRANQAIPAGQLAGLLDDRGYLAIRYKYKTYKGHRIAWAIHYGVWPELDIDHINGNKGDNRINNLRLASRRQNLANTGTRSSNTSGFKGVSFHKKTGRWQASIRFGCRQKYLGLFDTPNTAHMAYVAEAKRLHGEFYRP